MDAQGAAIVLDEDQKIAACLRGFHEAETVFLIGYRYVIGVVTRDLQEDSGVRSAFVGLPRGMEETRAEAQTAGDSLHIATARADSQERGEVRIVHLDVSEQREIIARADPIEMGAQDRG